VPDQLLGFKKHIAGRSNVPIGVRSLVRLKVGRKDLPWMLVPSRAGQ